MPSPEDKVTLRDVERETGITLKVITQWVDSGYLKSQGIMRVGVIGRRTKRGFVTKGKPVRWFFWRDVQAILAKYRPGFNNKDTIERVRPQGHLHVSDAANALGMREHTLRCAISNGKLPCVRVPMNGVSTKRFFLFVPKFEIERIKAEAEHKATSNRPTYGLFQPVPDTANPLISADDGVCLEARTQLWRANGRIIPRKYLICVAGRRKTG
jgi:hypothetical protein